MTDLPSFFNRTDFIGKYLPGYVFVVSYVVFFKYKLIFDSQLKLDVDLFTALVFIVAGPAFGYTITHLHRSLPYIGNWIFGAKNQTEQEKLENSHWKYAKLRSLLKEEDKSELDLAEAEYDFDVSTALVFVVLEALTIYHYIVLNLRTNPFFQIAFIILAACLFANAHYQFSKSVRPLIVTLFRKYGINRA